MLPKNSNNLDFKQILSAFLLLYYLDKNIPKQILISYKLNDKHIISSALNTHIIDRLNKYKDIILI
ncbi:hypothetical protein [Candidatus Vesicomyidisocius calyptogenae]|uniref:hypothetical protein n=1 Tax=Vesicomyosocius okutanii subsp. Calyptogena okutanii (strain HA) TaxID=412965 RepID=UPI003D80C30A